MSASLQRIATIAEQFKGLPYDFAFLGGAVLEVLITDKGAPNIRTTKDVDVLVNATTRKAYSDLEALLRQLGFKHDTSEDAPICRWIFKGIVLDVMPPSKDVLGWNTRWLMQALASAVVLDANTPDIRIVTAPYFLASKIEAFEGRGKNDFISSHDMEDFISVINGRETIVDDIKGSDSELQQFLANKIAYFLKQRLFVESLDGHLADESDILARKKIVLDRLFQINN
jgi:hypothetical protein